MKYIIILSIICTSFTSFGQVSETMTEYNRTQQAAVVSEFKYSNEIVEKALRDKFERMGYKFRNNKGFFIASGAIINDISNKPMDYAFKVERKNRKEKDVVLLTAFISDGGVNATVDNSNNLKAFLANLMPSIEATNLDFMVNEQYNVVVKAQKKLKNLQDDQTSIERKVRNLQDDLKKNAKEQEDLQKEIGRQQEVLDAYKAKKTTNK